ncbi:MAG TPA: GNVR domain-containing protein [Terracidiphilus sp.]|nr:GNVR domain-containing protein [Terracidiphilus sp.]
MQVEQENAVEYGVKAATPNWVSNALVLWAYRGALARTAVIALLTSVAIAFLIPKQYESTARIMPPETSGASAALLTALAGRGSSEFGALGSLASSLLGVRTTGPLYVDLLRSGTVAGDLIDRFQLQQIYHKRYRIDTAKKLARRTSVVEDKRSGVISITVEDKDPQRARDIALGYLDELNLLLNKTNTSSARQERIFIERRLQSAQADLERAQQDMSEFASTHTTIDIKEQTRATVDAAARLESEVIVEQSELDSLRQIYGDDNVRIRAARARLDDLHRQLQKLGGTSAPLSSDDAANSGGRAPLDVDYPSLRQIPRLAVPYADIFRRVRVQEEVYEMLTQQYELARIEEAKDIPVVRVIDMPGIPEKKSFPPRTLLTLLLTVFSVICAAGVILARNRWSQVSATDARKILFGQISESVEWQTARVRSAFGRRSHA